MKYIDGGVCAAKGFKAAGVFCGVKANSSPSKKDLALIYSEIPCAAAGIFTKNQVKAAPVLLDMELIKGGVAQAIVATAKTPTHAHPKVWKMPSVCVRQQLLRSIFPLKQ